MFGRSRTLSRPLKFNAGCATNISPVAAMALASAIRDLALRDRAKRLGRLLLAERWLVALLLVAAVARLYHFDHPPDEFHEWRYTQTLMEAASYGNGAGWFTPEISWYGAVPRVGVLEFPLYQILTYLVGQLVSDLLIGARVVSWVSSVAAIFVFDRICALRDHPRRRTATVLFALSPLAIFQGHAVQPESLLLLCMLAAAYCALRAVAAGRAAAAGWAWALGATALLAVAATNKPTTLVVLFPVLVYLGWTAGGRLRLAAIVAGATAATLLWGLFVQSLLLPTIPDWYYFNTDQVPGSLSYRLDIASYKVLADRAALIFLPPLLVGLVVSRSVFRRADRFWWAWVIGSLLAFESFTNLMVGHFYYEVPFIPGLAALAAYGAPAWPRRAVLRLGMAVVLVGAVCISLTDLFVENPINVNAGRALAAIASPGKPVLVLSSVSPYYFPAQLYYSGHPGWVRSPFISAVEINQLEGVAPCEMVIVLDGPAPPQLPEGWQEVGRTSQYVLGRRLPTVINGQDQFGCP